MSDTNLVVMNNKQEDRLSMYYKLRETLNKNTAWNLIPQLNDAVQQFFNKIEQLETELKTQQVNQKGYAEKKSKLRIELEAKSLQVSGAISAMAFTNNDVVLTQKMNYSPSMLLKARDTELLQHARFILDTATDLQQQLIDFGIEQADLDAYLQAIEGYETFMGTPQIKIIERKEATEQLLILFKETDALLRYKVDRLMALLKEQHPRVVGQYTNARKVIKRGNRFKKLTNLNDTTSAPAANNDPGIE